MANSSTPWQIRPVSAAEMPGWSLVHQHAFHVRPHPPLDQARHLARFEFDRNIAAFDGDTLVGTAGIFSFRMRVPGALVPVAGVTMIAVLPTHRRRGILTALMRHQLAGVRERGEAVAALFASETGIYGRYGYGRASWHAYFRLAGGEGALSARAPRDPGMRLRLTEPGSALAEVAKVYEQVLAERPGVFARNDAWWDRVLNGPGDEPGGATPLRCLLAEDDTGPRGYALFTGVSRWDGPSFLADSALDVREVMADGPAAATALWGDLLSRDLTTEFTAEMRPVDDPLLTLLADPRRARAQVSDGLWARVVDVGKALAQRRYTAAVDVVIEVGEDAQLPGNQGRWRLATGAGQGGFAAGGLPATCERTTAPPDVTLPIDALGATYLGGTRLGDLARAGLVTEHTPGAVAALSTALSWEPAPWCPIIF
jgi:predicted acetyltransferase